MADSVINVQSAAERVVKSLAGDFEYLCHLKAERLAPLVESEIELMVLTTLIMVGQLTKLNFYVGDEAPSDSSGIRVIPQYRWDKYRVDFCIIHDSKTIFIECDGHDFHERTKEQAERDRAKDRAIQAAGIPILRFTGREIWRDASQVVVELLKFIGAFHGSSNG